MSKSDFSDVCLLPPHPRTAAIQQRGRSRMSLLGQTKPPQKGERLDRNSNFKKVRGQFPSSSVIMSSSDSDSDDSDFDRMMFGGGASEITLKPAFDQEALEQAHQDETVAEHEEVGGNSEKPRISEDRQKVSTVSSSHVMTKTERKAFDEGDPIYEDLVAIVDGAPKRPRFMSPEELMAAAAEQGFAVPDPAFASPDFEPKQTARVRHSLEETNIMNRPAAAAAAAAKPASIMLDDDSR